MQLNLMNILEKLPIPQIQITEKNRNYFLGGFLCFVFLFFYLLIIRPQIKIFIKLGPEITNLAKDLKKAKEDIENVDQHRNEVSVLKEKLKWQGNKILSKEEISTILENISRLASETKVQVTQIMPIRESQKLVLDNEDGRYYSLPILVNARGGYHNIGRFYNLLESDKIFMGINDFDIAASGDDPMKHSVKMTVNVFVREKAKGSESK